MGGWGGGPIRPASAGQGGSSACPTGSGKRTLSLSMRHSTSLPSGISSSHCCSGSDLQAGAAQAVEPPAALAAAAVSGFQAALRRGPQHSQVDRNVYKAKSSPPHLGCSRAQELLLAGGVGMVQCSGLLLRTDRDETQFRGCRLEPNHGSLMRASAAAAGCFRCRACTPTCDCISSLTEAG